MYGKFKLGTSWRLKNEPAGDVYTVLMQSIGSGAGPKEASEPSITFERNDEMVRRTVSWALENMVQA
jgi:hypothetical protein